MILVKKDLGMQSENKLKVAVYMITYNHESYIAKAIDSVIMQETNFDFHIFLGEDCSTDNTATVCKDYANKYPDKITLYSHKDNVGATRNGQVIYKACFESGAKYIAMLEGDDYWTDPLKLQKQIDFLEENDNFTGICHNVLLSYENEKRTETLHSEGSESKELGFKSVVIDNPIHTSSFVFRNHLLGKKEMRILAEVKIGDRALFTLIANIGSIYYMNFIGSCYRINGGSVWTPLNKATQVALVIDTYKKIKICLLVANKRIVELKMAGFYFSLSNVASIPSMTRIKYSMNAFFISYNLKYLIYGFKLCANMILGK